MPPVGDGGARTAQTAGEPFGRDVVRAEKVVDRHGVLSGGTLYPPDFTRAIVAAMDQGQPVEPQTELSERDRRCVELFRRAVVEGPRERATILLELNNTLRPLKMGVVMMGGRKHG
jgi:hypothetical protein